MPTYEQCKASIKRYMATQDEIRVRMAKESHLKEAVLNHVSDTGETVNAFMLRAIRETMYRDCTTLDGDIPPAIKAYMESKKAGE